MHLSSACVLVKTFKTKWSHSFLKLLSQKQSCQRLSCGLRPTPSGWLWTLASTVLSRNSDGHVCSPGGNPGYQCGHVGLPAFKALARDAEVCGGLSSSLPHSGTQASLQNSLVRPWGQAQVLGPCSTSEHILLQEGCPVRH